MLSREDSSYPNLTRSGERDGDRHQIATDQLTNLKEPKEQHHMTVEECWEQRASFGW